MDGPKPCISMENVHFACIGLPMVSKFVGNPTLCLHRAPLWCQKSIQTSPIITSYASELSSAASEPTYGAPKHRSYTSELNSGYPMGRPLHVLHHPCCHMKRQLWLHEGHKTMHLRWETQIVFTAIDRFFIDSCMSSMFAVLV